MGIVKTFPSRTPGGEKGKHSGGEQPPYDQGMESRISRLEELVADGRERFARVEVKLDHVAHEVSQFKWWLVGAIITIIVTVLGTSVAIQQMTVATFQAAGQQANSPAAPAAPIIINVPMPAAAPTIPASQPASSAK